MSIHHKEVPIHKWSTIIKTARIAAINRIEKNNNPINAKNWSGPLMTWSPLKNYFLSGSGKRTMEIQVARMRLMRTTQLCFRVLRHQLNHSPLRPIPRPSQTRSLFSLISYWHSDKDNLNSPGNRRPFQNQTCLFHGFGKIYPLCFRTCHHKVCVWLIFPFFA